MSSIRMIGNVGPARESPCGWCEGIGCHWDRIGGRPVCPDCQELLLRGEAAPLILRRERRSCAACGRVGTVRYLTFPLHENEPIEIDICPAHLRDLMARRLTTRSFRRLRRQLNLLGLAVEQIFLLHETFYDEHGMALRPLLELT